MKSIAILLTVFNRKEKTLECLKRIHNQEKMEDIKVDIYLTNDGCTDGTPEAIQTQYPEVRIINGDGNLFWNRGMYIAWEEAAKQDYDFYLWLNDDTHIFNETIINMINSSETKQNKAVIVAATKAKDKEITTYSGHNKKGVITPNGNLQPCDTFNGNCVLIPAYVFKKVGNLDWRFRHAIGDYDYGCRAKKAGIELYVSSQYLGICDKNPKPPIWARKDEPFLKRIKNLYSPLGYAEPIPFFYFERKNFGLLTALTHFITIHIRVLFPQLWKQ